MLIDLVGLSAADLATSINAPLHCMNLYRLLLVSHRNCKHNGVQTDDFKKNMTPTDATLITVSGQLTMNDVYGSKCRAGAPGRHQFVQSKNC